MSAAELDDVPTVPALLRRAAERFGARPFLITRCGGESFAQTAAAVEDVAARLAQAGVAPGDRVLLQGANAPAFVHAWLGAIRIGALPAPVNTALSPAELSAIVADIEPRLVLADAERLATAKAGAPGVPVGPLEARVSSDFRAPPAPATRSSDPAALVFTSGTTARPKGAIITHAAYVLSGEAFRHGWVSARATGCGRACRSFT